MTVYIHYYQITDPQLKHILYETGGLYSDTGILVGGYNDSAFFYTEEKDTPRASYPEHGLEVRQYGIYLDGQMVARYLYTETVKD